MRYSVVTIKDEHGDEWTLLLRDDGYRIHFQIVEPSDKAVSVERGEWYLWAEYKQSNFPQFGWLIAAALMSVSGTVEVKK